MTQTLRISVVIPSHDGAAYLGIGLSALAAQRTLLHEVIVVDDCSRDASADIAAQHGAQVIRLDEPQHANYCRNLGARHATGDVILFLDQDVVIRPDTLQVVHAAFADDALDAMVGIYSAEHRNPNLASRFKNFWIRYSYLRSSRHIDWIFGAISVIRRDLFHRAGGFDHLAMISFGIDDLELGKRMSRDDIRIRFNPHLEVEHLKHYSFASFLANQFDRSRAFVTLAGRLGELGRSTTGGFVNVYPAYVYGTLLSWPLVFATVAAATGYFPLWSAALLLAAHLALGLPLLNAFRRQYGMLETFSVAGLVLCDHLACTAGAAAGFVRLLATRRPVAVAPGVMAD